MVVVDTEPLDGVSETEEPKPVPDEVDTSKPVGGVTTRLAVRSAPDTVNDCSDEAVPAQVAKALSVPVVTRVGVAAAVAEISHTIEPLFGVLTKAEPPFESLMVVLLSTVAVNAATPALVERPVFFVTEVNCPKFPPKKIISKYRLALMLAPVVPVTFKLICELVASITSLKKEPPSWNSTELLIGVASLKFAFAAVAILACVPVYCEKT